MKLQYKLEDKIEIDGKSFIVNASFDVILRILDLLEDKRINTNSRILLALKMLIDDDLGDVFTIEEKAEILKSILENYVQLEEAQVYDILGNPMPKTRTKRLLDYTKDSGYIYASFMQTYRIDLIEEQGKLHWAKFQALMEGLPSDSKIKNIMWIRGWSESEEKKSYKHTMQELQSFYALDNYDEIE